MHGKACDMRIRPVTEADAGELLEIYRPYVEKTAITFEYEVPAAEEFRRRIMRTLERYPYIAAVRRHDPDHTEEILGYAYAGPFKEREAYDWAVETSIYVKMGLSHHGIGRLLYEKLEEILKAQGILNLNACIGVPQDNKTDVTEDMSGDTAETTAAGTPAAKAAGGAGDAAAMSVHGDEYLTNNSEMFHAHMGYHLVGRFHRCGYKFGRWYDMVWMEKFLSDHPENPRRVVPYPALIAHI